MKTLDAAKNSRASALGFARMRVVRRRRGRVLFAMRRHAVLLSAVPAPRLDREAPGCVPQPSQASDFTSLYAHYITDSDFRFHISCCVSCNVSRPVSRNVSHSPFLVFHLY